MTKSQELPGAAPPGPLPGLCPGPAGGLSAPPRPPAVLGNDLWSLLACLRHAMLTTPPGKPLNIHVSVVLENFLILGPVRAYTRRTISGYQGSFSFYDY